MHLDITLVKRSIANNPADSADSMSKESILDLMDQSLDGFSLAELKYFSFLSMFISLLGFFCHTAVLYILVYQQVNIKKSTYFLLKMSLSKILKKITHILLTRRL